MLINLYLSSYVDHLTKVENMETPNTSVLRTPFKQFQMIILYILLLIMS